MSRLAPECAKVVLTGEGSDDTLGSPRRYCYTLRNIAVCRVVEALTGSIGPDSDAPVDIEFCRPLLPSEPLSLPRVSDTRGDGRRQFSTRSTIRQRSM